MGGFHQFVEGRGTVKTNCFVIGTNNESNQSLDLNILDLKGAQHLLRVQTILSIFFGGQTMKVLNLCYFNKQQLYSIFFIATNNVGTQYFNGTNNKGTQLLLRETTKVLNIC